MLKNICLYNGIKTNFLDLHQIAEYLSDKLGKIEIEIREDFLVYCLAKMSSREREIAIETLAKEIAKSRILDPYRKEEVRNPLDIEINYEKKYLLNGCHKPLGNIYNGFNLILIFSKIIPEDEANLSYCHIVFTNQLFATWDEKDLRYHARVIVFGFPSLISTTGIVEAPAKPREFYLKKQMGIDPFILKEEFKGRFIDYDDPYLTEVMKGYVMQAIFFHLFGEPFCQDKSCRLYNAHWQEEVIWAQLKSEYEFCPKHQEVLTQIKSQTCDYTK
ncbi:MAG: DUF6775 family putative metallopeptidase [Candidatus Aminicenantia bacterium]